MESHLCSLEIIRYYSKFPLTIPDLRAGTYALLRRSPLSPLRVLARLACLIHAANVHSEPGSNPSCVSSTKPLQSKPRKASHSNKKGSSIAESELPKAFPKQLALFQKRNHRQSLLVNKPSPGNPCGKPKNSLPTQNRNQPADRPCFRTPHQPFRTHQPNCQRATPQRRTSARRAMCMT